MRRCQRGMTAEINFCNRSEPAEMKAFFGWNKEGSLRKIVFSGNGLKNFIL